jgi:hypothetical protein
MKVSLIISCLLLFCLQSFSQQQDSVDILHKSEQAFEAANHISNKSLKYIDDKYSKLSNTLQNQSEKLLTRMQQKEAKLQKKLQRIDSAKAPELFQQTKAKYAEFKSKLKAPIDKAIADPLSEYIPEVDSLQTMMKFFSHANASEISANKLQQIQGVNNQVEDLQARLQAANEIQDFIRQRESQLKAALANTNLSKELLGINKEVFYYQQRLQEYKALLRDKKKLEEKAVATVRNLPAFNKFMQKYSYLSQLFPTPHNESTTTALAGLQTRTNVQNLLTQRIAAGGNTGTNPQQYLQQQVQTAQTQMNKLKDKINELGGGNSNMTMPDFKPNNQKTKTFLQRLQYGINIQSQQGTAWLPAMSDFALTLGYKFNENKVVGFSASYKMGWGKGWNHLKLTNEGVGLRSYMDVKAKGSIWLSGGFEYNYMQRFASVTEIKNIDVWQRSALLGISKRYAIGKKREGNIQLLYDFLHDKQVPQTSALKFRMGWTF